MNEIFFIPSGKNNKIKQNDINNGYIRITENNKKYFPNEDCEIIIVINNVESVCSFRIRNQGGKDRSYTVQLGKELIDLLNIKTSDILECQKISGKKFVLKK